MSEETNINGSNSPSPIAAPPDAVPPYSAGEVLGSGVALELGWALCSGVGMAGEVAAGGVLAVTEYEYAPLVG